MCKGLFWGGGRAFVQGLFFKWFQWSGSSGMQSFFSFFFFKDFAKQQYHVISHMLPEPEILALLQGDLLVKQICHTLFSSDFPEKLDCGDGKANCACILLFKKL